MVDRDIVLEALSALCNANVTSLQKQSLQAGSLRVDICGGTQLGSLRVDSSGGTQLLIKKLIPTALDADETSQVSRSNFEHLKTVLSGGHAASSSGVTLQGPSVDTRTAIPHIINEDEFLDKRFDYDFTNLTDTETYYRGGETYERPSGWHRSGLKVLDKYESNAWLGNCDRSTQSVPGEWPVSYHGTSTKGAEGIIEGCYKPGPRQLFGRGIYSTPHISEAEAYAKTFTSKNGKKYKVILQNRINPEHREKHNNDKYWLVPISAGISDKDEQEEVEQAIRPYGLLLKEIQKKKHTQDPTFD